MKREVQSKGVTAECAFEIIKRDVQSEITAECAFEIMKRAVQSKVTFLCAFEIMKREEYMRLLEFMSP